MGDNRTLPSGTEAYCVEGWGLTVAFGKGGHLCGKKMLVMVDKGSRGKIKYFVI